MRTILVTAFITLCGVALMFAGGALLHQSNGVLLARLVAEYCRIAGFALFMAPTTAAVMQEWDLSCERAARRSVVNACLLLGVLAMALMLLGVSG